jgi:hypothetical protein
MRRGVFPAEEAWVRVLRLVLTLNFVLPSAGRSVTKIRKTSVRKQAAIDKGNARQKTPEWKAMRKEQLAKNQREKRAFFEDGVSYD